MISRISLNERVQEWGLREDVVEKDYVLGWILWGIGSELALRERWVHEPLIEGWFRNDLRLAARD
jgi:hypothetical protein